MPGTTHQGPCESSHPTLLESTLYPICNDLVASLSLLSNLHSDVGAWPYCKVTLISSKINSHKGGVPCDEQLMFRDRTWPAAVPSSARIPEENDPHPHCLCDRRLKNRRISSWLKNWYYRKGGVCEWWYLNKFYTGCGMYKERPLATVVPTDSRTEGWISYCRVGKLTKAVHLFTHIDTKGGDAKYLVPSSSESVNLQPTQVSS